VLAVVSSTVACGCGGGGNHAATSATASADRTSPAASPPPHATAPDPLDECKSAGRGWRPLAAPGVNGAAAARLGNGSVGVVFADDSDDDPCSWAGEARALVAHRYAVAVFRAGGGTESRQALTVAAALRRTGARRVVLIGASVGARAVLQAGAEHPRGVVGLVALSAERKISTSPADLLPLVRRVRLPVLSVGSRADPLTRHGRDTRAFDRTFTSHRLLMVDGHAHGVELLRGRHGPQVRAAILRFLRLLRDGTG
jgi:pimeloyl-ACP methyl ester carboxylesterase